MTDRADVHVGLGTLELFLGHDSLHVPDVGRPEGVSPTRAVTWAGAPIHESGPRFDAWSEVRDDCVTPAPLQDAESPDPAPASRCLSTRAGQARHKGEEQADR